MNSKLPLTRGLTIAYRASLVVAATMTVASLAGLVSWSAMYPGLEAKDLPLFVGQDALNLIVGLPLLLGSMWLAARGSVLGLLLWPGALFYVVYDYGYYVLGAPFNALFIPYLVLVTLSAYTAVTVIASIDGTRVRERLSGALPVRLAGAALAMTAMLFMLLWSLLSLSAFVSGASLDPILRVVTIMDLTVQLPALLLCGVLLWRGDPLGFVAVPALLLQAAAYLLGLSAITVLQEAVAGAPVDPVAVVPGVVVSVAFLALLGTVVQGADAMQKAATAADERRRVASVRGVHAR